MLSHELKDKKCYTENEVISMLEFEFEFIEFGEHIQKLPIGIQNGINRAPLLGDICKDYTKTYQSQYTHRI